MRLTEVPPTQIAEIFDRITRAENDDQPACDRAYQRHAQEAAEPNRRFFMAAEDGQPPHAYVQLIIDRADNDPELANGKTIAHIHDLYVAKSHRRRGLAKAAMKELENVARARGLRILTLGVDEPNRAAQALYKGLCYVAFKSDQGPHGRCDYMRKTLVSPFKKKIAIYLLENFGPLIAFYSIQSLAGLKAAIIAGLIVAILEIVLLKKRNEKPTLLFKFTTALALIFGALDLSVKDPVFFKFEAGLTNLATAAIFAVSLFQAKPLVQEIAERRKSFDEHDPRDVRFFFQLYTAAWVFYFVAKAAAYTYINFKETPGNAVFTRIIIGNVSLAVMIGLSIFLGRPTWKALSQWQLMPSARGRHAN